MGLRVHLITGFLGSGKTRLLRDLSAQLPGAIFMTSDTAPVPFDLALLDSSLARFDAGGCICCAGKADALNNIAALAAASEETTDLFVETSGMSDTAGLIDDLAQVPGANLRTVVVLVDASQPLDLLATIREARGQLALADFCLMTHLDALSPEKSVERRDDAIAALRPLVHDDCTILVRPKIGELAHLFSAAPAPSRPWVDRGQIAGLSAHDMLKVSQVQLSGMIEPADAWALAQAILCLNPRLLRFKMRTSVPIEPCEPSRDLIVQIVNGRLQPVEFIPSTWAGETSGLLHMLDPNIGDMELRPLLELFFGSAVSL